MKPQLLALSLVLASGTAEAQTVISRQITDEPVETIVTQGPYGTVVTRRLLRDAPVLTQPAPLIAQPAPVVVPEPGTVQVRPYGSPVPAAGIPIVAEEVEDETPATETVGTSTTIRRSATVRTAPRDAARSTRARTTNVTRRSVRSAGAPLDLTPAQQRTVYRTIVDRQVYAPGTRVIAVAPEPAYGVPAAAIEGSYAAVYPAPAYSTTYPSPAYSVTTYPAGYAAAPATVTYTVGSVLPSSVALAPVPQTVAAQIPLTRGYRYAIVGDRVLLVDPSTGMVVADVTQ